MKLQRAEDESYSDLEENSLAEFKKPSDSKFYFVHADEERYLSYML